MSVRISGAVAAAACNSVVDLIDAGATPGTLVIYEGARPANVDTAIGAQPALVNFVLAQPSFGDAAIISTGATATAAAVATVQADATGTAQFFRIFDANGVAIFDGDVTDTNGAGDLKLSSTAIIAGIDVTVVSLTATMPKG